MPYELTTTGYSDDSLWNKIMRYLKKAGYQVIEKVLWLYYACQRPETPAWAMAVIVAALAYFINPVDAIPDPLPGGLVDDAGVLATAVTTVAMYITDEVKLQAKQKLDEWFGSHPT